MTPPATTTAWAIKALKVIAFLEGIYLGFAVMPYAFFVASYPSLWELAHKLPLVVVLFWDVMSIGSIVGITVWVMPIEEVAE